MNSESANITRIAIFASGTGSNAKAIVEYFKGVPEIQVALIISNRKAAGVLEMADNNQIPKLYVPKEDFSKNSNLTQQLQQNKISLIVLAGFLLKIPEYLIEAYPDKILNIHPALLPKYGGKGMYGKHVHQAVYDQQENESGITIHLVNEKYDEGKILFQASVEIDRQDGPSEIAAKVLEIEHYYYPRVIKAFIENSLD